MIRNRPWHLLRARSCCSNGHLCGDRWHAALAGEVVEDLLLPAPSRPEVTGFVGLYLMRWIYGCTPISLPSGRVGPRTGSGLDGIGKAIGAALAVVVMFTLPWLLMPASLLLLWLQPQLSAVWWWLMSLAALAITQQLLLRLWTRSNFDLPLRHWWLMGVGGLLVGAIGPVSIWRTRTGRGWTWKGRALG